MTKPLRFQRPCAVFLMCILCNFVNNLWVIHKSLRSRKAAWDRIHCMEGKSFIQREWKAET